MDTLVIEGHEQQLVDTALPDGGLPPALGVQSFCVFRASRDVPELTDGRGWTYHHHVDMACWRGRLYVGWNSCERDEDVWPSRELYSSSIDGAEWAPPLEMFPQGVSTPLRIYFYRTRSDRMLVIAGLRSDTANTDEDKKGALVVRELREDHTLGEVFTLQALGIDSSDRRPPMFHRSTDDGFVDGCRQLLADHIFLEQQDRGRLLGERRMKWHDAAAWSGGVVPGDNAKWVSGKAFSFFRRPDGAWVGVSKMGWTTVSTDNGETWSQPAVPSTLITGKAKVWLQQTADGRWAMVYNPTTRTRYPLVVVTSGDGVHFGHMRIVQGELPIQRYAGRDRSIGPQYIRGISHWADDHSRESERAMWLVYSMSKEDIWVSRVPLPVHADETADVTNDLSKAADGPIIPGWNTYSPKWTSVTVASSPDSSDKCLQLHCRDPYDYARAMRVFRESPKVSVAFQVRTEQSGQGTFEIELLTKFGSRRPVRVMLTAAGIVQAADGERIVDAGRYEISHWHALEIVTDATRGVFDLHIDGKSVLRDALFAEPADVLHRISFRTSEHRGIGGAKPVEPGSDKPTADVTFNVRSLRISTGG